MTAALLLSIGIARRLNGNCATTRGGVLSNDGAKHADCSGCHAAQCGKSDDMGLADSGFRLSRTHTGLMLNWPCPTCGVTVSEPTTLFSASADAKKVAMDAACCKCRKIEE